MACKDCMERLLASGTYQSNLCMLCRQPFQVQSLIRLQLPTPEELQQKASPTEAEEDTLASASRPDAGRMIRRFLGLDGKATESATVPRFTPAAGDAIVEQFLLPPQIDLPLRALSSIPRKFLTHLRLACGGGASVPGGKGEDYPLSAKMTRLVDDLREVMAEEGEQGTGKSVVFSSHKRAIGEHIPHVLRREGIGFVRIVAGDSADSVRDAVTRWNHEPTCRVFLCHVGAAAAGLTLTAARHCFLMEPLVSFGEEAQAMNRCHRIGQTRQVEVTMYYCRDSVEERILAHRIQSGEPVLQSSGHNEDEEAGELSVLQESQQQVSLGRLHYFLGIHAGQLPAAGVTAQ